MGEMLRELDDSEEDNDSKTIVEEDENAKGEKISSERDNATEMDGGPLCGCMGVFDSWPLPVVDGSLEVIAEG
ncbi:hypothetical protein ACLOJK_019930 [Asimina triloba]